MLAIRIVSGPQTGSVIPLQEGQIVLGRGSDCTFPIASPGVSKHHAKIEVLAGKIIISDMGSSNGTFVNGVQIRNKSLQLGDKIALHQVLLEVIEADANQPVYQAHQNVYHTQFGGNPYQQQQHPQQYDPYAQPHQGMHGGAAPNYQAQGSAMPEEEMDELPETTGNQFLDVIKNYMEDVVLPGVYRLPEYLEFKWVLGIFMAGFIVLVTSLSTIPLIRILKTSVERESQEHALTIAKTLAEVNAPALSQGLNTAVSVAIALKRPGVKDALIISDVDGAIIAPASKSGSFPDIAFVHDARKRGKEAVSQVDSDTVVALAPMEFYNAETGSRAVTAYSVVVYDMGSLSVDDGKTLSLFIQTLFISLIIGSILFFFLYKMIEYPLKSINYQLNEALKSGTSNIEVDYDFPVLEALASNISSSLSRSGGEQDSGNMGGFEADRTHEMSNLLEMIGFGAMAVSATDRTIAAMNPIFEEKSRLNSNENLYMPISDIPDQALNLSLADLLERVEGSQDEIATNDLEFNGESFQIAAQAILGSSGISYFLVVLLPMEGGFE